MAQDVGEALLDDAVGAVSGGRRNVSWHGLQAQVDVHSCATYTVNELGQVGEALRRSQRSLAIGRTNDLQRGAQFRQRVGRAPDDVLERVEALIGLLALQMEGRRGLRIDPDQGVRDRVVELVRQTQALLVE